MPNAECRMPDQRYTFPRSRRLQGRRAFAQVFAGRVCRTVGPLRIYGRKNDDPWPRMGLSVSRRVGTAVRRNRIKRLLREAFRLSQHQLPAGLDMVVVVRPHEPRTLEVYTGLLVETAAALQRRLERQGS
jgi:ribonuclease P protein component